MKNKHYTIIAAKVWRSALLLFLLFAATTLHAQVSTYQFSQSMGTYTPITGGTVLTSVGNEDDNTYAVSLPFSFQFNNVFYTDIYVSANGYISFGTTDPGTGTRSALNSTAAVDGIAAPFSADLQGGYVGTGNRTLGNDTLKNVNSTAGIVDGLIITGTGIPAGTVVVSHTANTIVLSNPATSTGTAGTLTHNSGEIRVEDLGSEFVIQWSNWKRFTSSGTTNDNNNFQVRLNPADNSISFVYGPNSTVSTSAITRQVGLRGATNSDFFNRSTTTDWSATTQGASNSASCSFRNTIFPADGLTYTFMPPELCTVAEGGTITPNAVSRCLNQSYVMTATGFSQGTGTSYQWQVSETSGGPYVDVTTGTGATTTTYNTGALTVPGVYYYVLKTTCSECGPCDDVSDELVLTVNALPVIEINPSSASVCNPGGTAVELTASGALTYAWSPSAGLSATTGDVVEALPGVSTVYTAVGTDVNGCTGSSTTSITVNVAPSLPEVTPSSPTICAGGSVDLYASSTFPTEIGTGGSTTSLSSTSSTNFPNPFSHYYGGSKHQMLILASELSAAGFSAGSSISSFGLTVASVSRTDILGSFLVRMGHTALTSITSFQTGLDEVRAAAPYTTNALPGVNMINFDTPFVWDGSSNVIIETSYSNVDAPSTGNVTMSYGSTGFQSTIVYRADNIAAATMNGYTGAVTFSYSARPKITFQNPVDPGSITWSPADGLSATTGSPVTASPLVTTVYTVTASAGGCESSSNVTVTSEALSCVNISVDDELCGSQNFTLTANYTGGGAPYSFAWSDGVGGVYPDAAEITANLAPGTYTFSVVISDNCGANCNMSEEITVNASPGGFANGPSTGETYQDLLYIVSGYEAGATIDWQFATALAGPYTSLSITSDTAELFASSAGTFYVQAVLTGLSGCQSVAGPIETVVTVDGDNVCDAIPLVVGGTVNGPYTNQGATLEPGEQVPPNAGCNTQTSWCNVADHTVWFTFVAPSSGRVSLHFSPANWDSEIAVWQAASCSDLVSGSGVLIAANDDSASSPFNAYISPVCLTPGETYFVQVDRYGTTQINSFGLYILEHADPLTDTWYADLDGDTYGDINSSVVQCSAPSGYVGNSSDCDDQNAAVNPGATEICNAIDDDCDGTIDEDTEPGALIISGSPTSLCWPTAPGIGSYSVTPDPSATAYTWSVPSGMFITGGQGTSSITIQWTASAANTGIVGNVTCTPSNACFDGPVSVYPVSITTVKPVTPGSISGPAKICPGDEVIYSVANVARASFYQWTLPAGCSIVGSSSGNIITVSVDGSFAGGTMSVQAGNACGLSPSRTKGLTFNNPLTPGPISGQASGVCGSVGELYSIGSVANALSYQWSVGVGGTIQGSSTGTMVAVDYDGSLASTVLSVSSVNGCGVSAPRNLTITGAPGVPSVISGPVSVCTGAIDHYSVNTVVGAVSYTWTAPGTVVAGQGTKEVDIMWGSSPASSQQILVRASNDCGDGPLRTLGGISINFCPRISGTELDAALSAYPNPATDLVTVSFNLENSFTMKLNDVTGRNIMTVNNEARGQHIETLDVSTLNGGVYLIVLETADGTQAIRLVVE